ncbi:MAG: ROK family protein [Aquificota bacterium]|nr:ROK family protein [Aquificota bacterium]
MFKGVDIGGTFVKVLWEDGRREKHYIRDIKGDRDLFLERIREIALDGDPDGVGLAVAGFTSKEGVVFRSPNIPSIDGVDFKELLGKTEVAVGNDVTLGAYGEWFYDHRDSEVLILVAVGTGLGGGLVLGGRPYLGVSGSAMEIGHHIVERGGYPCSCGRKGCWEAYCSSYGLERMYRDLGGEGVSDREVVDRAKGGEETALRAVETFREYLLTGLLNLVHILNPDCVVLAGGVIEGVKDLLGDLERDLKERVETLPGGDLRVSFSSSGEFMGARGALAFILSQHTDI